MEFSIRPVQITDAPGINLLRRLPGVMENTLGIPSERVTRNEDGLRHLDGNAHQFVAVFTATTGEEV
ncbi:MAG: GNAT family N-acetyltransferase, partial [Eubacteriales bacterium]|nr:GNAT family N-acetyltransferase [Eubacteriales bacterium]